ncbi:MAG: hypothetical protein CL878_00460 [Dehalococcoidia bacterium]|nr:hypothetical protein [Dehalococcoidia bacterium]
MKTIIVLPTYNEVGNLEPFTKAVLALKPPVSILVVDDNSPDGTGVLADRLHDDSPERIHVLHRAKKEGLGAAIVAGFQQALALGAERIFQMDADFSHPVEAIPRMLQLSRWYDVVVGSRYVAGGGVDPRWHLLRRLLSRGGNLYARWVTGLRIRDTTTGFRCFRASTLRQLPLAAIHSQGYVFQIEVALVCQYAGWRMIEEPIFFRERSVGKSKMNLPIAWEAFWRVWKLRRGPPWEAIIRARLQKPGG